MKNQDNASGSGRKARGRPRDWHDKTAQNTIKSLDRAIEVFEFLSEEQGKPLTTLAKELQQSPATVYRILVTLESRGLVDFDVIEQVWHIGPKAFIIGSRFLLRTSLVERARPFLRALMEATGETANLGIERNGHVLFVSQVETNAPIRAFFAPGTLSAMHASGIGKALLAHLDETRLKRFTARGLESFTPYTLSDPQALAADMVTTRARGYALDDQEKNLGMRCIAAPILNAYGEVVAGISVSGPTTRVTPDQVDHLAQSVMRAARDVSTALGAVN